MTNPDGIRQMVDLAAKLDDEELRWVLHWLSDEYKLRLQRASAKVAVTLRCGDWIENVKDGRKLPAGAKGHVVRIRRNGTIDVHFTDWGMWTVDAALVRKIDKPGSVTPASKAEASVPPPDASGGSTAAPARP